MENELRVITDNSTTFSFRIIANGPLNTGIKDRCVVYVEINKRENVLEERIPLKIDFPEYSIPVRRISEMNLDEVGSFGTDQIHARMKQPFGITFRGERYSLDGEVMVPTDLGIFLSLSGRANIY